MSCSLRMGRRELAKHTPCLDSEICKMDFGLPWSMDGQHVGASSGGSFVPLAYPSTTYIHLISLEITKSEVGWSETNREIILVRSHARTRGLVVRSELGKVILALSPVPLPIWAQEGSSSEFRGVLVECWNDSQPSILKN